MDRSKDAAGTPRNRTIETKTLNLAALEWGRQDGPRVLALHGWLDNAASFDRLAPRLDPAHLIAIDLPGHGHSDHLPPGTTYHFVDGVAQLKAAADRLGWERFSLLGHSMGAGIATLFAGTFPDRVERLVLLEGLGPLSQAPEEVPSRLAKSIESEWRLNRPIRRLANLDQAIDARVQATGLDRNAAEILVRRGTETTAEGDVIFRHDPRLKIASRLRMTEDVVAAFLKAITCRVLIVWADQGWPFPRNALAAREQLLSRASILRVAGGHHVHLTHPERIADHLRTFLNL